MTLSAGTIVTHPTFGPGRVLLLSGPYASIYFPDLPGTAQQATKKLHVDVAKLAPAPDVRDPRLENIPIRVANDGLVFPKAERWTYAQGLGHFLQKYPGGFGDSRLFQAELDYKRKAVDRYAERFGGGRGGALLASGAFQQIAAGIDELFQATNIPSLFERLAVRDGVKHHEPAAEFLRATFNFVEAPGALSFADLVEAVDGLPAEPRKAKVLTWPIVTLLPFLADPTRFMVLKPAMTKVAAERLYFDIDYDSTPNWHTYERVLSLCHHLLATLTANGARDFVDVHSFLWVTAGEPAMEEKKK